MAATPITHSIDIAAPIDTVWALTLDVESWPEISPTMTSVNRLDDGPLQVGSQARIKQPGQGPRTWTVTRLEAPRMFSWTTTIMGVTVIASHELVATERGCRNLLRVEMTGTGSALLTAVSRRPILKAITQENEGFRAAAEEAGETAPANTTVETSEAE